MQWEFCILRSILNVNEINQVEEDLVLFLENGGGRVASSISEDSRLL